MYRYLFNGRKNDNFDSILPLDSEAADPLLFHMTMPGYTATPLYDLPGLASKLGVGQILLKDESQRFDLKAFKILGASYAIYLLVAASLNTSNLAYNAFWSGDWKTEMKPITLCTATDGNHGRGVARMARLLKLPAEIYMPRGTVPARIENIRSEGAEVVIVDGNYDRAVERACSDAAQNDWTLLSDTSFPGYEEIPRWITCLR